MSLYITDESGKLHKIAGAGGGSSVNAVVDSELSETSENPVQNKVITNALKDFKIKLLWENPNPTANITTGTINLSSSDYDYLIFVVAYATYDLEYNQMIFTKKGNNCKIQFNDNSGYYNTAGDSIVRHTRTLSYANDITYNIGSTSTRNWMSNSSAVNRTGYDNCVIPLYVLGVKL